MTHPKVAVIVLNWNGIKDTVPCIDSLLLATYPNLDIVVVDNASAGDDASRLASQYNGRVHVIVSATNLGFAGGNNLGIQYARETLAADHVLLLNNDTEVQADFIQPLVQAAEQRANAAVVASKMYYHDPPDLIWYAGARIHMFGFNWHSGMNQVDRGQFDDLAVTDYAPFASVLITKRALDEVGYLCEDYFLQWEDIDYCMRAKQRGLITLYVPESRIWHKVSRSSSGGQWKYRKLWHGMRGRVMLRKKLLHPAGYALYLIYFYAFTVPIHSAYYLAVKRDFRLINAMVSGAWSAISGSIPEEVARATR